MFLRLFMLFRNKTCLIYNLQILEKKKFFLFITQAAGKIKEYCLRLASYLSTVFLCVLAM